MCDIVVECQCIVYSGIYIIWICKHIKCWASTVFTMCHPPSLSSTWYDHIELLPTQEGNTHLSTDPHPGASLSGTFDMIFVCAVIHLMQLICGIRLYLVHETLSTRRMNGKCVHFSRSLFFPGVVSSIWYYHWLQNNLQWGSCRNTALYQL